MDLGLPVLVLSNIRWLSSFPAVETIGRLDPITDLRKTIPYLLWRPAVFSDVRSWLIYNRLLINDSTSTEFLVVGSRRQSSKIAIDTIMVADSTIQPLNSVRDFGSWFDSNMPISIHIGKIYSKAFHDHRLHKTRQISKFLSPDS